MRFIRMSLWYQIIVVCHAGLTIVNATYLFCNRPSVPPLSAHYNLLERVNTTGCNMADSASDPLDLAEGAAGAVAGAAGAVQEDVPSPYPDAPVPHPVAAVRTKKYS